MKMQWLFIALLVALAAAPGLANQAGYVYYGYLDRDHYEYYATPTLWEMYGKPVDAYGLPVQPMSLRDAYGNNILAEPFPINNWPYGTESKYSSKGWRFGYYTDYYYSYENRAQWQDVWVEDGRWEWVEAGSWHYCSGRLCRPGDNGYYYERQRDGSLSWKWCGTSTGCFDIQPNSKWGIVIGTNDFGYFERYGWSHDERSYWRWRDTSRWERKLVDHWDLYYHRGTGLGYREIREGWNYVYSPGAHSYLYMQPPPVPPVPNKPPWYDEPAAPAIDPKQAGTQLLLSYNYTTSPFNPTNGGITSPPHAAGGSGLPTVPFPGAAAAATATAAAGVFVGMRSLSNFRYFTRAAKSSAGSLKPKQAAASAEQQTTPGVSTQRQTTHPLVSFQSAPSSQTAQQAWQSNSSVMVRSLASRAIPLSSGPASLQPGLPVRLSTFGQSLVYNPSKLDNLEAQVASVPDRSMSKAEGLLLTADALGIERVNVMTTYQMYEPAWNQMRYPRRETAVGFDIPGGRESVPQRMAEREQLLHRISVLEHEIGYKTGEFDRAYELSDKMSQAGFTLTVIGGVVTASSAGLLLPVGGVMVGTGRMLTFSAGTLDFLTGGSRILDGSADARDWTRFLFSPLSIIVYNKAGIIESFRAVSPSAGVNLIQKSIVKKAIKTVGKETAEYLSTELAMQIGEDGLARLRPSRVIEVSGKWGVDRPLEPNLGIGMPIENTPARDRVTYVNGYNGVTLDVSLPLEQRYARQPTEPRFVESASYSETKSPAKSGGLVYYGESRTPVPAQKSAYGPSHGLVTSGDPGNKPPVFTPAQKSGYGPSHGLVSNNGGAFTPAQKWAGPKK